MTTVTTFLQTSYDGMKSIDFPTTSTAYSYYNRLSSLVSYNDSISGGVKDLNQLTIRRRNNFNFNYSEVISTTTSTMASIFTQASCEYIRPAYLEERFWLVSVVGTSVAMISVVENAFLFIMLLQRKSYHNSHCLYLILLAFFDIFMGAAYVPLMSVSLLLDYLESIFLLRAWYAYMIPLITTSHIAMTSSSFLILATCFERYCITCWTSRVAVVNRYRAHIAAFAILLGVVTKITLAIEFEIIYNKQCRQTMHEYSLKLSDMALDYYYNLLWRLGFRNVVTVLLPFFLLLAMNLRIVAVLRGTNVVHLPFRTTNKLHDIQRKANVLNVFITFWEYVNIRSLTERFIAFYTFGVDTVSILTILAGALRLPIYVSCMPQLRREIFSCIKCTYDTKQCKKHIELFNGASDREKFYICALSATRYNSSSFIPTSTSPYSA